MYRAISVAMLTSPAATAPNGQEFQLMERRIGAWPTVGEQSTNSRELFSCQHCDDAVPPDDRSHGDHPRMLGDDFADEGSILPQRVLSHDAQDLFRVLGGHDRDKLAFIRHVKRI